MGRGLLQRFEKGVKSAGREHVHFVDNVNLVFAQLWRNAHLFGQRTDVVNRVVGGGIQFVNIV